ncbi:Deuterolysin metalloprotease family-domain-containing protein [Aspergillus similis]
MLFASLLLLLAALAAAKPLLMPALAREASLPSFDVTLQVANLGPDEVRLIRRGGILDPLPTQKVTVQDADGAQLQFSGVHVHYVLTHLNDAAFIKLSPNHTVESVFDIASMYTLSAGQDYTATANGALEYTTLTDTDTFSTYNYRSNQISFTAPSSHNNLKARTTVECSNSDYNTKIHNAIERAAKMAAAGAADARNGASDNFKKFFFTTDQDALDEVAERLEAIATETTTTGSSYYYCEPRDQSDSQYCDGNVAAFTVVQDNTIVTCDLYYDTLEASNSCSYLDQGGIVLHEYTHASQIYSPGTEDIVYGYENVQSLQDTEKALNNADSYAYYAAAIYLQCAADGSIAEGTPLNIELNSTLTSSGSSSSSPGSTSAVAVPASTETPSTGSSTGPGSGFGSGFGSEGSSGSWPWGQVPGASGSITTAQPTSSSGSSGGYDQNQGSYPSNWPAPSSNGVSGSFGGSPIGGSPIGYGSGDYEQPPSAGSGWTAGW